VISDYDSLKSAIADWLARADLTAQIPTFIQLAEARLNKDLRVLEMQSEYSGALISTDTTIAVPDDVLELQSVRVSAFGSSFEITPLAPERLADTLEGAAIPIGYVRIGSALHLIGGAGQSTGYSLLGFVKPQALGSVVNQSLPGGGSQNTTITVNWLLTKEPGAYLYASLIEASPYIQDDARTLVWAQQYESIIGAMKKADDNARYGNAPAMRRRGNWP
jgi:hypothetical protein